MDKKLITYLLPFVLLLNSMSTGLFIPFVENTFVNGFTEVTYNVGNSAANVIFITTLFIIISPVYFFAAPLLGSFSDYFGRKRLLLISVIFSAVGYFLSYLSTLINAFSVTILGIFIANIGYASLVIAFAAMSDVTRGKRQLFGYGLLGLAVMMSNGFSMISFYIIDHSTDSSHHLNIISFGAFAIQLLNIVLLLAFMRETKPRTQHHVFDVLQSLPIACIEILTKRVSRILLILLLTLLFTWGIFLQEVPHFLSHLGEQPNQYNILFITYVIILMAVGYLFVLPWSFAKFNFYKSLFISFFLVSLGMTSSLFFFNTYMEWLTAIPTSIGVALAVPLMLTGLTRTVSTEHRGLAMGLFNTGQLLAWALGSVLANLAAKTDTHLPLIIATVIIVLALTWFCKRWYSTLIINFQRIKATNVR